MGEASPNSASARVAAGVGEGHCVPRHCLRKAALGGFLDVQHIGPFALVHEVQSIPATVCFGKLSDGAAPCAVHPLSLGTSEDLNRSRSSCFWDR